MSIQVKAVNYIYDAGTPFATKALDDISFSIEAGEFIGVIGHTGSGKSSLMQVLNGLLKATSGQIIIEAVDICASGVKMSDVRKKVGMVFQYPEYQLFEETVYKDVAYGPQNLGLDAEEIDRRVKSALQSVGMPEEDVLEKSPFELSGGQKRRVAIAGILAMQPNILILDEPTAGLDPQGKKQILEMIKAEHIKRQNTVLFVSHSMEDVAEYADRILVIDKGRIVFFDVPAKVFSEEEALKEMGLDIPETAKIARLLRQNGLDIKADIYKESELIAELSTLLGGVK